MTKPFVLAVPVLLASFGALALARAPSTSPAVAAGGKIDQQMEVLQANIQRLSKSIDKKDGAAALGAVLEMQQAAQNAKVEMPHRAAELADAAKAEFVRGFRTDMIGLQHALLDAESALVAGKFDDARKIVDDKLKPAKKAGHDKYKGD